MPKKKETKDNLKIKKNRESVSTFSKMIEDQKEHHKKQIKALFGQPNRIFDDLELICQIEKDKRLLGFPSEQELEELLRISMKLN